MNYTFNKIIQNNWISFFHRAILFHVTCNMRFVYVVLNDTDCVVHFVFHDEPSEIEVELMDDVIGLLYGDNLFRKVEYSYFVNSNLHFEFPSNRFMLFAKYEELDED